MCVCVLEEDLYAINLSEVVSSLVVVVLWFSMSISIEITLLAAARFRCRIEFMLGSATVTIHFHFGDFEALRPRQAAADNPAE